MIRRLLLPLVAATALVACGGDGDAGSAEAPPATTSPAPTTVASDAAPAGDPATEVPAALQFSAPLVGGGEIELDAYAGRPVLLWFWAPW